MDIKKHQIWSKISPYKKPLHMVRFFIARHIANCYKRSDFIGITGSVGKTTTKEACFAVLSQKFKTVSSKENIDPILNIPATILRLRPNTQKIILEMGIEYLGEMEFYLSLVRPATAIVTRIGYAHSEFLGDINNIIEEKGFLVRQLPKEGFAILNADDINVKKLAKETAAQVIFYGLNRKQSDVWASNVRIEGDKTRFEINYGVERVDINFGLLGRHFVYSALAAAALGICNGLSLIKIKKGLEQIEPIKHRLQLLEGLGGCMILDDTYNSSPAAVEEALNLLNEMPARRRIVVLGEMKELGLYAEKLHRAIAQAIYKDKIDLILMGGGDTKYTADELIKLGYPEERIEMNLSNTHIVSNILKIAGPGDIILVKGSRVVKLDEVVGRISKQK